MKTCPICSRPTDTLRTGVKNGVYLSSRCELCLASEKGISIYARKYDRDRGREDYRKDIIQRFDGDKINPEFVDAYRKEASAQWGSDVLRDYGENRKQH